MSLSEKQQAFADELSQRWDKLALAAAGCSPELLSQGAVGRLQAEIVCVQQGAVNLGIRLKKGGAGPQVQHWFSDARPRYKKGDLVETELDTLGNELKVAEDAAIKEGLIKGEGDAGKRMVGPGYEDRPVLEFIADAPRHAGEAVSHLKEFGDEYRKAAGDPSPAVEKLISAAKWIGGGLVAVGLGVVVYEVGRRL